jgi:plastocyanin
MKKILSLSLGLMIITATLWGSEAGKVSREVVLETKKMDDAVHWTPEKVEVTPGEKIKFVVKHELEGGFDFHGFFIPKLNISEQVNRNEPKIVEITIPKSLKPGEYPIGCQFHPKHVRAILVVSHKKDSKK